MSMKRKIQTYQKGEVIFCQGDASPCMYDIQCGRVGIYANFQKADEKLLTELKSEEFFGEMGMIEGFRRSATAVALEDDTRLEIITPDTLAQYFEDQPTKVLMIMQHMSQRIRGLTADYLDACRAVVEVTQTEGSDKGKSSWLKGHMKKFMDDYNDSMRLAAEYDSIYPPVGWHWM